jgi:hypothetical protein
MANELPESWQIFIGQYPQLMKLQRKLGTTDWYARDGWVMFIGHYHAGIYAQLYKSHWYNHTLDGIHLEMGLSAENLASKTLSLDLHIGHRNLFDREKFNQITIPKMAEAVSSWEDVQVKFSRQNLSERLTVQIKFTKIGFPDQVTKAFTRLSALGPIIDEGLAKL